LGFIGVLETFQCLDHDDDDQIVVDRACDNRRALPHMFDRTLDRALAGQPIGGK
jgi:hypothetical protein